VDLSAVSESGQAAAIAATASRLHAGLNLTTGPLLQFALFELGSGKSARLLIVIHHLAVDGVSWRILLEDLQTAYEQLSRGEAILLPPKTTSFKRWAERLVGYGKSSALRAEQEYWLAETSTGIASLPRDHPTGTNTEASARTVVVSLSVDETRALLQDLPKVYDARINDLLLAALTQVLARWTGERSVLINLEGHGREEIFDGLDLSRTVGWFATIFPVLLTAASCPGETLKAIKEKLRRVPNRGIGYGLLRYQCADDAIATKLNGHPQPEMTFNYLGQFDQVFSESSLFAWGKEATGPARRPTESRRHVLSVDGRVIDGQLQVLWFYSSNLHRRSTVETLARSYLDALRSFINRSV
jgi:non-ribosomal peptide synthase protein (TIGR01720 family)